ncbi:MAG: winged helix-turn-helix transcriptional regulator [Clostridia bacterium]|nr:winged helix-turn-helix transcriptional regulator [Clostridia bacterium]
MRKALRDLWTNQSAMQALYEHCIDPVCKKYEISPIEFKILMFVHKYPDLNRAADIVKYKGISKSYVSLSLKCLSERGLIKGEKRGDDRKNIYLTLLPAADPLVVEGLKAQKDYLNILLTDFDKDEVDQLLSFFNRMNKNVKNAHEELNKQEK